jgi:hypothetical protein
MTHPAVGTGAHRTDATAIRGLRRFDGLLKMVHIQSGGAYSERAGAAPRAASGHRAGGWRAGKYEVTVKKVPKSKKAPPMSKVHKVRALVDYIAGPNAGGDR